MSEHERDEGIPHRLAEAVANRTTVDWEQETSGDRRVQRVLENLKLLDEIGIVHGALNSEGQAPAAGTTQLMEDEETPTSWGHLRILRKIGEGSYGEVFLAEDSNLKKKVALKLLRPHTWAVSEEDGFLEEARKLARVRHPNVLTVHGADRIDGRVGIWTDFIDGETLEEFLQKNGSFGPEEAAHVGNTLCKALAGVHAAGIVHGDIKTANVMREKGGRIVLMDFSSASDRPVDGSRSEVVSGTPLFMAPEVFQGEVNTGSDIYSLGVVLFRLVSGQYPIRANSVKEVEEKHLRGEYESLRDASPHLPDAFVGVVEHALSPDPGNRYASAGEMGKALAAVQGASVGTPEPRPPFWRRPETWIGAAVTLAIVLGWILWPDPFEVEATLFRKGEVDERLAEGVRVAVGDLLFLEIKGSEEMHVYAMNQDQSGQMLLLFPIPESELSNPLSKDDLHRLPGSRPWEVSSAGGSETILIVASNEPVPGIEKLIPAMAKAGDVISGDSPLFGDLRGIAGLGPPDPTPTDASEMSEIRKGLAVNSGHRDDLWVWELQLSNPGP